MSLDKLRCDECDWHGLQAEMLKGVNPFDPTSEVVGCPDCKAVSSLHFCCDEPGCWVQATCGTPTAEGYRNTCWKHVPHQEVKP